MKNQKSLIITILILLVALIGAYVLYNSFSEAYAPDSNLSVMPDNVQGDNAETDIFPGITESPEDPTDGDTDSPKETTGESSSGENSSDESSSGENSPEKHAAPDFTVYDSEGNAHKLSDFSGKPVILNFWASWCGPCKSEMPAFDKIYSEYGDKINFLIVNLTDGRSETVESAKKYIDSNGYSFPVYYDTDMDGSSKYGVYSIPTTFFIDSDGNFAAYAIGALSESDLRKGVGMIYSEDVQN